MKTIKTLRSLKAFLFILFIIITITSCEKEEKDKLPAESMSGRNTFGCLINGEAFLPEKTTWTDVPLRADFIKNENLIIIHAFNSKNIIRLGIENPPHGSLNETVYLFMTEESETFECEILLNEINNLSISSFDLNNRQISGTFNLKNFCNSELKLTEGRFDLPFDIY